MKLPRDIGPIHFVGIGGIGMSGIAEVLINLGYTVQGSDAVRQRQRQAAARQGHRRSPSATRRRTSAAPRSWSSRPRSSATIRSWSPRARSRLPVVRRAEMLAELMRLKRCVAIAGTHGKTTTTSMVAALLDAGGFDPTVINGGIINAYGTNARLGAGDWMVVEADESDGTFLKLPADVAIVTNVDPEHLDHFKTFDAVQAGVPRLRRERAVLRLRRDVHRPSGGADAGRPHRGPPRHHLWREPAGRRAPRRPHACRRRLAASPSCSATAPDNPAHEIAGPHAADAGAAQRAQRHRGDRGRARARHLATSRSARRSPASAA